jgi:LmbE family N-acetylglucosaminyl deacetylase
MDLSQILPVPNLLDAKRIIAFSPHPDDNEVGAGGTLAKLAGSGSEVYWIVASDGGVGTEEVGQAPDKLREIRHREQEEAAATLGAREVRWLGFKDTELRDQPRLLESRVVAAIRELVPDFVLCPDPWLPYEAHPDHRALGHAVSTALLMANLGLAYPESGPPVMPPYIAYYGTAWPNTTIDITATFDVKLRALMLHQSQWPAPMDQRIQMYLTLKAQSLGETIGVARAEAFKVLTSHHLHFNVDTWQS